ncbi:hypothetical protein MTO96_035666, partial [Rhipicephalus appendiculatus]
NLYPSNIMRAHMETTFLLDESYRTADVEKHSADSRIGSYTLRLPNQLGLLSFSVILGLVLSASHQDQNVVLNVFVSLSNTLVTATHMLMWFAPVGLCSITMALVLQAKDLQILTGDLSMYIITFLGGDHSARPSCATGTVREDYGSKTGPFLSKHGPTNLYGPRAILQLTNGAGFDSCARRRAADGSAIGKDAMALGVLEYITIGSRISTALNVIGDVVVASGTQELCRTTLAAARSPEGGSEVGGTCGRR